MCVAATGEDPLAGLPQTIVISTGWLPTRAQLHAAGGHSLDVPTISSPLGQSRSYLHTLLIDMACRVSNASHVEAINASDFKARCFAILDRVQATGEGVVILKRGRPVAELLPASQTCAEYAQFELKGTVIEVGDIVKPAVPAEHWGGLRS